jgi:hypothetical protein
MLMRFLARRLYAWAIPSMLFAAMLLSACNGGGGGSDTINSIAVPPEPDAAANNATLAGVDSNSNGVRDDVERSVATVLSSKEDFDAAVLYLSAFQKIITSSVPSARQDALTAYREIICSVSGASSAVKNLDVESMIVNTGNRKAIKEEFDNVIVGFSPEELPECD